MSRICNGSVAFWHYKACHSARSRGIQKISLCPSLSLWILRLALRMTLFFQKELLCLSFPAESRNPENFILFLVFLCILRLALRMTLFFQKELLCLSFRAKSRNPENFILPLLSLCILRLARRVTLFFQSWKFIRFWG